MTYRQSQAALPSGVGICTKTYRGPGVKTPFWEGVDAWIPELVPLYTPP